MAAEETVRCWLTTRPFQRGLSLLELLVATAILGVLAVLTIEVGRRMIVSTTLATSTANLRLLSAGAANYLGENNYVFWPYLSASPDPETPGVAWWFGLEPTQSFSLPEGKRYFDPKKGPLGGYIPGGLRPDPSFRVAGKPFKPKYQFGYIGIGYNVLLGGGWRGNQTRLRLWDLERPGEIVVFATSAQVTTLQRPASRSNPMIEEFYGIDDEEISVHFRHRGRAIVAFANGSVGFLDMDPSTLDRRAPEAQVGRFAPKYSSRFLR